jgi:hypothetical protein
MADPVSDDLVTNVLLTKLGGGMPGFKSSCGRAAPMAITNKTAIRMMIESWRLSLPFIGFYSLQQAFTTDYWKYSLTRIPLRVKNPMILLQYHRQKKADINGLL